MLVPPGYAIEEFSEEERSILGHFFTELDGPVFAVVNLPEVVKGALFARYSRSPKSVRRLFLDEFYDRGEVRIDPAANGAMSAVSVGRAEDLYERVFNQYGDDSVAQLGGAHLACEQASNVLTKVLEWGRLAAYLEQSTRYMFYDEQLGGRYRYHIPVELAGTPLQDRYTETMDGLFATYSTLVAKMVPYYEALHPPVEGDSSFVWRSTIRAKACDDLRGLLPASTTSNVGIFATGQAYEALLLRMQAHPLDEVRGYARLMLTELRKVIPAFLKRVDVADRGGAWSRYLADVAADMNQRAAALAAPIEARPEVTLVEWDPDAEVKVAAAALYSAGHFPDDQLLDIVRAMPAAERDDLIRAYAGKRGNRRHKPGRAMERASYRFDILCDYGIFRDLQRHRLLTLEWQRLSPRHGFITPEAVVDTGGSSEWEEAMERAATLFSEIEAELGSDVAQYAVPFAYRIRFYMQLNARAAFHLIELRTQEGGHADYRRVCQEMHRQIRDRAGHRAIAEAMEYADYDDYDLARLGSERKAAARRAALGIEDPD